MNNKLTITKPNHSNVIAAHEAAEIDRAAKERAITAASPVIPIAT